MNTFECAVGGMADIPQWFAWKLTPNPRTGKYDKHPCTLDGARCPINASDPANWNDFDTVATAVNRLNASASARYAAGFWLTSDCGYWFLDIDHALGTDNQWAPFADQLVRCYPGAMVERSSSGHGLHVIGMGDAPPHRNKPPREAAQQLLPIQLEFYSAGRGIAFGLDGHAQGCADSRFDIAPLVTAYFPPNLTNVCVGERRYEWRGPADDDELLRRMLSARVSAAAAFGGKATVTQLWNGQAERNSENDMALASHLAFWTGCDEERIARLMLRSAMKRDKWSERRPGGTYLTYTIANACAACTNVYREAERPTPPSLAPARNTAVRNAYDLQNAVFQPIQWALQDLLPEGVTILSSDPKLGKSWMVYTWCIAIASGSPIWEGREPEKQGDALLLALEDNDRRMRRRLDKLLPTFGNPKINRLFYACDWPRHHEGVAAIRQFLVEHPETRIVVIDTIAAFRDADPGRKTSYQLDYEVGAALKPLAQEFQCAFVLVSHNRKPGGSDTHVNQEVSGTQGLTGGVDNVFVLKRSSGNITAVLHTDGRDIETQLELALQLHDGKWQCVGNAKDVNRSQQRNSVREAIVSLRGCGTAREIHEAMGAAEKLGTLRVRLSRMVRGGELDLNGKIYTLVEPEGKLPPLVTPPMPGVIDGVIS